MAGIFKAYDIRGIYGKDLTEETAYLIGRAFITLTKCRSVVVARDIRPHSEPLFTALTKGITQQGADVIDIGYGSTPMSYFANGTYQADGSIMLTASHNPAEWNGFKLCRAQAVPISGDTGIFEIETIINEQRFAPLAATPGRITSRDISADYARHVAQHARLARPIHVAFDFANGMGIWEAKALQGLLEWDGLFEEPDGRFPNHEANPLNHATLKDLQAKIRQGSYDFGVAFDGDADRAGFVDEQGDIIPMDLITALVAQDILATRKGVIFYDLRSSRVVKEVITAAGGTPMMCRVGHAFIKQQMREHDALFAGELSGHYYFKDNFTAESSALAILALANIVSRSDKKLSELVAPLRKFHASGEINTRVTRDPREILSELKKRYADGELLELDGVSVSYPDWWFNVRCSNTEPLVRLNIEAANATVMATRRDEILAVIRG